MINDLKGSLNAERSVLGAVLIDERCAARVFSSLNEEAFSYVDKRNAYVFRAIGTLIKEGKPVDIVSVDAQLGTMQLRDECNSPDYLNELSDTYVSPSSLDFYINTVRDYYTLRKFFEKMDESKNQFVSGKVDNIGEFLSTSVNEMTDIANHRSVGSFKESKEIVDELLLDLQQRRKLSDKRLTGLDTGYRALNDLIHGWQPETLNIIGARSGVGKTAFALNLLVNGAMSLTGKGKTLAFFSCEMSAASIMRRIISAQSTVKTDDLQLGNINKDQETKILSAADTLSKLPIYFDDTPNQALSEIIAKCEKIAESSKGKLAGVFIDFLNIIQVPITKANESRTLQIGEITLQLKEMARRLKIPVILLAQLNRDADKGTYVAGKGMVDSSPEVGNLKESSTIEQNADTILLLYRSDWGNKNKAPSPVKTEPDQAGNEGKPMSQTDQLKQMVYENKANNRDKYDMSVVEINLAKHRDGSVGKFALLFEKSLQRFSTPDKMFSESMEEYND